MSFTAEVKEELIRIPTNNDSEKKAELSALLQVCGTLDLKGKGRYDVKIATETGSVARMLLKLTHGLYQMQTKLIERRSLLHNSRNYLVLIEYQPQLDFALKDLGIIEEANQLASHLPCFIQENKPAQAAFLRGCFMASGYIAKPTKAFRMEFKFSRETLAKEVVLLLSKSNINTRYIERNQAFCIRLKNFNDIVRFLYIIGANKIIKAFNNVKLMKTARDSVNRLVNAEMANMKRASKSALEQVRVIHELREMQKEYESMPNALKHFCDLRLAHPDLSLAELGKLQNPPLSKSAISHQWYRVKRLYCQKYAAAEKGKKHDE